MDKSGYAPNGQKLEKGVGRGMKKIAGRRNKGRTSIEKDTVREDCHCNGKRGEHARYPAGKKKGGELKSVDKISK